jgi:hypothetical protein
MLKQALKSSLPDAGQNTKTALSQEEFMSKSEESLTILIPDYEFDDGKETDVIFISKSAYLKNKA